MVVPDLLLLLLTIATPRVSRAAPGPMILSGLAPDAFDRLDATSAAAATSTSGVFLTG